MGSVDKYFTPRTNTNTSARTHSLRRMMSELLGRVLRYGRIVVRNVVRMVLVAHMVSSETCIEWVEYLKWFHPKHGLNSSSGSDGFIRNMIRMVRVVRMLSSETWIECSSGSNLNGVVRNMVRIVDQNE